VLLGASFTFYSALKAPHLIIVLLLITVITFFTGILIDRNESSRVKQYLLWGGISANVLTLIILKYLPFITQNLNAILCRISPGASVPVSKTIVAIGASYFIFQAISYLIDIYLEVEKPERHFGHFTLFMSFFPKLLQGPIERGGDLLPQLKVPYVLNLNAIRAGFFLFSWGLFKKTIVADKLSLLVDPIYDNALLYKGFPLLFATYCYAFQIYFDFSGYTDMAIGSAKIFNIRLNQNFNRPYTSTSIADFWRRWHITFSRWILDYIFKPLQMSLRSWGAWGIALSLLVTFTISGVWHGASWGFVIWGFLHGIFMAISVLYRKYQKTLHGLLHIKHNSRLVKALRVVFIFNIVCFAWIFFRAPNFTVAKHIVINAYNFTAYPDGQFNVIPSFSEVAFLSTNQNVIYFVFIVSCAILANFIDIKWADNINEYDSSKSYTFSFRAMLYFIIAFIVVFANFDTTRFIYFRF
jgi:D-alanyl-lipoteichoic acid acyltransferase DltB (MBOAT superfamily)